MLLYSRSGIETSDNSSQRFSSGNGSQTSDSTTDDEYFSRRQLTSCCHLTGEESAEVLGGHDDCFVAGCVGHGGQGVKSLSSSDTGDLIHSERCNVSVFDLVHQIFVLSRPQEGNQSGSFFDVVDLVASQG